MAERWIVHKKRVLSILGYRASLEWLQLGNMDAHRYTARIESLVLTENASYSDLLKSLMERIVRAAVARAADESTWEYEELRKHGLCAVQFLRDGRALWREVSCFRFESLAAEQAGDAVRFYAQNELDPGFFERLGFDLREKWARAGYACQDLCEGMKDLFRELEADALERAAGARRALIEEIVQANS